TISGLDLKGNSSFTKLSSQTLMNYYRSRLDIASPYPVITSMAQAQTESVHLMESYEEIDITILHRSVWPQHGACAMQAVEQGIQLCKNGKADALVTGPISKEAVNRAGYHIPGHTEFLAEQTGTADFMMMLVSEGLRVGLV